MPIFKPNFSISIATAQALSRIEVARERVLNLPLTPHILSSLRESARLFTTHYSTMIEGNKLAPSEVQQVLQDQGHFPGKERDEKEVRGYYKALTKVEQLAAQTKPISEKQIQELHALVLGDEKKTTPPTPYRDGQNVIKDSRSRTIVYLPPEAQDVGPLMKALVEWINAETQVPTPIVAAIAHYQFATIHPYYDGNGRTARLLTTLILHKNGYDLKGLYSLEEYYAQNLNAYYQAISVGPSHNYYMGRAEADISRWVEYFTIGMAESFENVLAHMQQPQFKNLPDQSHELKNLDARQRKALTLFLHTKTITSKDIAELFAFKTRTASHICKQWVEQGFFEIVNPSNKARTYKLAVKWAFLLQSSSQNFLK